MNYGKKNAAKIKWQLTSRGTVMRRKVKSLTLLIILLCFVLVLGYGGYRGYQYVEQIIAEAPDINEIDGDAFRVYVYRAGCKRKCDGTAGGNRF